MKIWYQSLFDAGRIPAYFDGVRKRVATVARPGTEVASARDARRCLRRSDAG